MERQTPALSSQLFVAPFLFIKECLRLVLIFVVRHTCRITRRSKGPKAKKKLVAMLRKRKEPKKSIAMTLMRDVRGSAAEKLRMFEKMRAAGGVAKEDPADLAEAEKMLRAFAAMEKGSGERR